MAKDKKRKKNNTKIWKGWIPWWFHIFSISQALKICLLYYEIQNPYNWMHLDIYKRLRDFVKTLCIILCECHIFSIKMNLLYDDCSMCHVAMSDAQHFYIDLLKFLVSWKSPTWSFLLFSYNSRVKVFSLLYHCNFYK